MKAKTIKAARVRQDHSYTAAAHAVGVTEQTWRNWERRGTGKNTPEALLRALREYVESAEEGKGER